MPHALTLQDYVTQRLQQMPGVQLDAPQGAFYVMPEASQAGCMLLVWLRLHCTACRTGCFVQTSLPPYTVAWAAS